MLQLKKYRWEGTLVGIMAGVIIVLTLVTHLTARSSTPPVPAVASRNTARTDAPPRHPSKPSDPLEVLLGPREIRGQFKLLSATRTPATPGSDKLTLRVRAVSRAIADLVTPFQSSMLEVRSQGLEPIHPQQPFSDPVPAGNSRDEDVVFIIPTSLNVDNAVLRIHDYNEQREIPLRLLPRANAR